MKLSFTDDNGKYHIGGFFLIFGCAIAFVALLSFVVVITRLIVGVG